MSYEMKNKPLPMESKKTPPVLTFKGFLISTFLLFLFMITPGILVAVFFPAPLHYLGQYWMMLCGLMFMLALSGGFQNRHKIHTFHPKQHQKTDPASVLAGAGYFFLLIAGMLLGGPILGPLCLLAILMWLFLFAASRVKKK
ncbi:MAG: hypothetical protein LBQ54_00050 [Planctomycetaceae bacterium]|jgi:hypothetical protein|nr:hypothetical protein [Planctomycetaceae bacterium]